MDQKFHVRVMNKGFVIIRPDDTPTIRIKHKTADNHNWRTLEQGFASKAQRDRRVTELIENNEHFIID